jgi:hypothetical protein
MQESSDVLTCAEFWGVHCYPALAFQSRQQLLGEVCRHIVLKLPGLPQQLLLLMMLLLGCSSASERG